MKKRRLRATRATLAEVPDERPAGVAPIGTIISVDTDKKSLSGGSATAAGEPDSWSPPPYWTPCRATESAGTSARSSIP